MNMQNFRLIRWFSHLGIRVKLLITYLLLLMVPFTAFMVINGTMSVAESERQTLYSAVKALDQTASFIETKTGAVKGVVDIIALDDAVQTLINRPSSFYSENVGNWTSDERNFITKLAYRTYANSDITRIHLYMEDGMAAFHETEDYQLMQKVEPSTWFQNLSRSNETFLWLPGSQFSPDTSEPYVSIVRRIPTSNDLNRFNGLIRADILARNLSGILDQAELTASAAVLIINSDNQLVMASTHSRNMPLPGVLSAIHSSQLAQDTLAFQPLTLGTMRYKAGSRQIRHTDWRLLIMIPDADIRSLTVKSRNQMLTLLAFVIPLTLPLAYFMAASSTRRIRSMITNMRQVVHGDFNISILPAGNDEIGELNQNFNYMVTRVAMLLENQYQLGKEKKSLELRALQSQINPHFLYNTLDLIHWMAVRAGAVQISQLVQALSKFYKLSLSKGEDLVPLRNELDHIAAYLTIQNMRFHDSLSLYTDVPDALLDVRLPKLTLQPLVENAIQHGIREREDETGSIRITGACQEGIVLLHIADDGVGIPPDRLEILLNPDHQVRSGYGVRNIHERLQLQFGPGSGLQFASTEGTGTTVTLRFPLHPET